MENQNREIYIKIKNFEEYEISNYFNVKNKHNKILKPKIIDGTISIYLSKNKVKTYLNINKYVMRNFNMFLNDD